MLSQYNPVIDFLKIVSSFGIIWFHSPVLEGNKIGYSGLLFFIIISVYLLLSKSKQGYDFFKIYRRYLWPWVFWLVMYGLGNILVSKTFLIQTDNAVYSLLAGSYFHLWYLPFMFMTLVVLEICKPYVKLNLLAFWLLLMLWAITSNDWRSWSISEGMPISQYFHGFGAVCIGVLLSNPRCWDYNRIWILLFVHISIFLILLLLNLYTTMGVPYSIGVSLVYVALLLKSKFIPIGFIQTIKSVANLTFGIYLTHPLFIYLLKPYVNAYFLSVMVFMVSIVFVYILRLAFPKLSSYVM